MLWQSYTEEVLQLLLEICHSDAHVWRTRTPLICFDVVEYHLPDRVMHQFGLKQTIPEDADTGDTLHRNDRRAQKN